MAKMWSTLQDVGLSSILVLVGAVVLAILLVYYFAIDVITVLINGVIIYAVLYRAYFDLQKGRWRPYAIGTVGGMLTAFAFPRIWLFWDVTVVVAVASVLVEILRMKYGRKR